MFYFILVPGGTFWEIDHFVKQKISTARALSPRTQNMKNPAIFHTFYKER